MQNIVLIGFMGAGKSTVATRLSEKSGYDPIDLDALIEEKAGKKIREIFSDEGEDFFRGLESQQLSSLSCSADCIIATGGGVVVRPENWIAMKKIGCVVYLRARWDTLRARIDGNNDRPLVNQSRSWSEVEELLLRRSSLYEQADLIVDTDGRSVEEIVDEIVAKVEDCVLCRVKD